MAETTTRAAPLPPREMRWWGWGDAAHAAAPPEHALAWLRERIGGGWAPRPPVALDDVRLGPAELPAGFRERLAGLVAADGIRDDRAARVLHAAGKSCPDLVRQRAGDAEQAPDAVVLPADAEAVAGVLRACADAGVAVVPFGGGTSVVGGVEPMRGGSAPSSRWTSRVWTGSSRSTSARRRRSSRPAPAGRSWRRPSGASA